MKKILIPLALFGAINLTQAQSVDVKTFDTELIDWYNKDISADKTMGVSVDVLYNTELKTLTPKKTVIVAVIDGGVDTKHVDLAGKIWINNDEIPNNNIDDDNNGYVDDINGWNFIGGKDGSHIAEENFEITRILKSSDKNSDEYKKALELYNKEMEEPNSVLPQVNNIKENFVLAKEIIKKATGIEVNTKEDLAKINSSDEMVGRAVKFYESMFKRGLTEKEIDSYITHYSNYINYYLNKEFSPRDIVGDDPTDITDTDYGNNDVFGPGSTHGTFVSGIIAGNRDNGFGVNGIASSVKIMPIRVVPDGDERDKDIALGIRYAVDNGADIINMSFGKAMSPQKKLVDDAVKYAEEKGVLMIHAAGNSSQNVDEIPNYPNPNYLSGGKATNWLTVGANSKDKGKKLVTDFSNYGATQVDLFAPGLSIISTDTVNTYNKLDGTSFSAPVVSGVAALILSYYPELTPSELISILMESSYKVTKPRKVLRPTDDGSKRKKAKFNTLSKSGGIVNAKAAFLLAKKLKG